MVALDESYFTEAQLVMLDIEFGEVLDQLPLTVNSLAGIDLTLQIFFSLLHL